MDAVTHVYISLAILLVTQAYLVIKAVQHPTLYDLEFLLNRDEGIEKLILILKESEKVKHLNDERRAIWIADRIKKDIENEKKR